MQTPSSQPHSPSRLKGHVRQPYTSERTLVDSIAAFAASGLSQGGATVLIASPERRGALIAALAGHGVSIQSALQSGQLILLDVEEMLTLVMGRDGNPDAEKFFHQFGSLAERVSKRYPNIYAYGEMASLLWNAKNPYAAIELEQLWKQLAERYSFKLLLDQSEEQSKAAASLKLNEAFKNIIIESSRDCIKMLDLEGRIVFMNEGGMKEAEISNFSEVHGVKWASLWSEEESKLAESAFRLARAGSASEFTGFFATTKSKSPKWWHVVLNPVQDPFGQANFIMAVSRDVTERMRYENALRESERRLEVAMNAGQMGIFDWDFKTQKMTWSTQTELFFGFSSGGFGGTPEEFLGRLHADDQIYMKLLLDETAASRSDTSTDAKAEFRVCLPNGKTRWISGRGQVIYGKDRMPERLLGMVSDVTERKEMELELRHREELFRGMAEAIPQMVWTSTSTGKDEFLNRRLAEYVGVIGNPDGENHWTHAVHPEDSVSAFGVWKRGLDTGEVFQNEFRLRRTDGVYRWFLGRAVPVRDASGKIVRWFGTATDIEDHKQLMHALKESKDELAVILHGVTDGITVLDQTGKFIYANVVAAKLCGFDTVEAFLSASTDEIMSAYDLLDENGDPFPVDKLPGRMALSGEKSPPETLVQFRSKKTGNIRWSIINASPVFDDQGNVRYGISIFRDFTERKSMENSLQVLAQSGSLLASSLDYQTALKGIAGLVVPTIADWCAITLKEPAQDHPQFVAVSHADPKQVDLVNEFQKNYPIDWTVDYGHAKVFRTGEPEIINDISEEMLKATAKDVRHLELLLQLKLKAAMIVPLKARNVTLGTMTLISAESGRQFTETDLRIAEDLAYRAGLSVESALLYRNAQESIRARDEFISLASHELKTPITSLKLQLEMTRRRMKPEEGISPPLEKIAKVLDVSNRQVDRITALLEDMLDVSRIQAGKLEMNFTEVNLSEVVRDVRESFQDQLEVAHCRVDLDVQDGVVGLWDRNRIEQVVVNLLSNAVKYAAGSTVEIKVESNSESARFVIKDFGPGIAKEKHESIFERFERATSSRAITGLGLGLFIVRQIVEAHGGMIHVESDEGQGAKFIVELPLKPMGSRVTPGLPVRPFGLPPQALATGKRP